MNHSSDWCAQNYWDYLSSTQQDLLREGSYLYQEIFHDGKYNFHDYSFIVFPFAKAYEGFLKKLLLDTQLITEQEYNSNHIRIGQLLCPEPSLRERSIYDKIENLFGKHNAKQTWLTWKYCRNEVFHYYPHNQQSLTLTNAKERIEQIVNTMATIFEVIKR